LNYFLRIPITFRRDAVTKGDMGRKRIHGTADFMGVFNGVTGLWMAGNWRKTPGKNFKIQNPKPRKIPSSKLKTWSARG